MGGSSAWAGTTLPKEIAAFTTYNMSPRGPAFANAILKDKVIDATMNAIATSPTPFMGARLTAISNQQTSGVGTAVIAGFVRDVTDAGYARGSGTVWHTDLQAGDTVIAVSDEVAVFAVVEVLDDVTALFVTVQGWAYGVPGAKVVGIIKRVRRPIFAPPFLFNHEAYMTGADLNSARQLTAITDINLNATNPGHRVVTNVLNAGGTFADTITEAQLGLSTFADTAAAKAELQKSVAAATDGLAAANAVIAQAASANIAASITTYTAPMVAQLIAQRNADLLSMQRGYTIANGFFNTNVADRVAELVNKYAIQEAAMLADAGVKILQTLSQNAVQCIDRLLGFQNGPLRDRIMAQELRLKAMEVGARTFLAADQALQQRWSALYGAAQDAVKRDFANDHSLWGMREDTMRFNAELQQAYLGTVNAGIGKGTDAMGVTKQILGMAVTTAGAVAAFIPQSSGAAGSMVTGGAAMSGMSSGSVG